MTFPFDTCFVVDHFHYVRYGTIVFATFDRDLLLPKFTGRMLDELPGNEGRRDPAAHHAHPRHALGTIPELIRVLGALTGLSAALVGHVTRPHRNPLSVW